MVLLPAFARPPRDTIETRLVDVGAHLPVSYAFSKLQALPEPIPSNAVFSLRRGGEADYGMVLFNSIFPGRARMNGRERERENE